MAFFFGRKREKVKGIVVISEVKNVISEVNQAFDGVNQVSLSIDSGLMNKALEGIINRAVLINTSPLNQAIHTVGRFLNSVDQVRDGFVTDSLGRKVSLQLISSANHGKVGKKTYIEDWRSQKKLCRVDEGSDSTSVSKLEVNFDWDEDFGIPGAFIVRNRYFKNFYLCSLTLENVPGHGRIHFECNSWIHHSLTSSKRIFFLNKSYLPDQTPKSLRSYRDYELINLRGDGSGKRKKKDRIYDYDVYNDLGQDRPILGGSTYYPYPRRGRTGRKTSYRDGKSYESRSRPLNIYVPSKERFGPSKDAEFLAKQLKTKLAELHSTGREKFDSFQDVLELYKTLQHLQIDEELTSVPFPQVIQDNKVAWKTDEEFAREMLAGENPVVICRLEEFPPLSKLDPNVYGDQNSKITEEHIINSLDGLTVNEAMKQKKLYILNHHDSIIPFLRRINSLETTKTYATRTLLLLKDDGTLKPLSIELSLPHPHGDKFGAISRVVLPGLDASIWQLAKAYVTVNDTGYHQLVSHWLNTHAVIEPFVIATNRQLSILHPIHKLLSPHFKDTMKINALARESLINANGVIERTHYPSKYSMEMSSFAYKTNWVFPHQALPADLIKRGLAMKDSRYPHGLKLLIEDYPYAVDGLEIWTAINTWANDYCSIYYKDDEAIQNDVELQFWWKEVREKGHADKKNEPWWPKMQTLNELVESCTIIIWISSALHAALNFGQYAYGGFFPNRPSMTTRLLPEKGTADYEELESNPEKAFLRTISSHPKDNICVVSIIAVLSMHSFDEVYLGQMSNNNDNHMGEWSSDEEALKAFGIFKKRIDGIEKRIIERNNDHKLKNRVGAVNMPYTLLFPSSTKGLTGKGIPNSISI